jgi:hypothetical protein
MKHCRKLFRGRKQINSITLAFGVVPTSVTFSLTKNKHNSNTTLFYFFEKKQYNLLTTKINKKKGNKKNGKRRISEASLLA